MVKLRLPNMRGNEARDLFCSITLKNQKEKGSILSEISFPMKFESPASPKKTLTEIEASNAETGRGGVNVPSEFMKAEEIRTLVPPESGNEQQITSIQCALMARDFSKERQSDKIRGIAVDLRLNGPSLRSEWVWVKMMESHVTVKSHALDSLKNTEQSIIWVHVTVLVVVLCTDPEEGTVMNFSRHRQEF